MALIDRKRRLAALVRPLLRVAVEQKNVAGGLALAKLVFQLEEFGVVKDEPTDPTPAPVTSPEMVKLLESVGVPADVATST